MDDHGLRVCKDGPVFTGDLIKTGEFAHHHRGPSGRKE
jgi:dihydroorotate dehydrogenase electron transfer subunit